MFGVSRYLWIAVVPLTLIVLLWAFQRRLMYLPMGVVSTPKDAGLPRAIDVSFETDDGVRLGGWWTPALPQAQGRPEQGRGAGETPRPAASIVILNGNAGNRSYRAPLAAALARRGFNVLLFDYRGYGGNAGAPSESGLIADARAARRYVESRADVDPRRVVLFGESIGTGPATAVAVERPPAALVLRSPFTSMVDLARVHYGWLGLLLRDRFPSADRIGGLQCPLLVIAGRRDTIVPFVLSQRLFEAAPQPKQLVTVDADHNDWDLLAGDTLIETVVSFLMSL
jgi:pimeloyl-ACP methyl ester carboxylesterase